MHGLSPDVFLKLNGSCGRNQEHEIKYNKLYKIIQRWYSFKQIKIKNTTTITTIIKKCWKQTIIN